MVKRKNMLKGSVSEKLDQIDRYIWELKIRSGNYVIGITPPIPVFDYTDTPGVDGVVFRKIMPSDGVVTVGCMWVDQLDKKQSPIATLIVEDRDGSNSLNISIDRQALAIKPDMPVKFGQRITLKITPIESCQGIWTAFLFNVARDNLEANQQLMSGFLDMAGIAVEET